MAKLFDEIYSFISSHVETQEITRLRLSEGMKARVRETGVALSGRDVAEFLKVRFTQAFPRTAVMYSHQISDKMEEAFRAWMDFSAKIEEMLKEVGATWDTVLEALEAFLRGPEALREIRASRPEEGAKLDMVSSVASTTACFNIYSIPICLRIIFPYADPEKAPVYIREARKAFALIALAHLRRMYDDGSWDDVLVSRLRLLRNIVGA